MLIEANMHITVVMSVYNGEATIVSAIDSICRQTYSDWDLVIIDDGSTDGTADLLEAVVSCDPRIRLIRNSKNLGLAAALNIGWRQAKGELIARMDADDISLPNRFEKQVAFLANHPEVDVLGTAQESVDANGEVLGYGYRPELHEELASKMYRINPMIHPSVVMRRSFLEALEGYDESKWLLRAEDADLWLRGYKKFRFHNLQEPLLQYRISHKPSTQTIAGIAYAQLRAAYREGLLLSKGWYALRAIVAGVLIRMNIYQRHYFSDRAMSHRAITRTQ
jgi:glycosyltransferase involved in cell wall biosynthesis